MNDALSDGRRRIDEHTVYLGRLPPSVNSKQQVLEALQEFGQVVHVHLQDDLSHGFVHFSSPSAAEAAVKAGGVQILQRHVDIREAKPDKDHTEDDASKTESVLQEGEECFYWRGRMEKFRRGHGFLRPLPGGEELPGSSVESTIQRGVYVSPAQVERFDLADGDVVGAKVRPPRSQEQRFGGDGPSHLPDEQSWALLHVCDVNGEDSSLRVPRRQQSWDREAETETFEWTGMVECWRKDAHGFLRPLAKEDRRSVENPEVPEAEKGVFLSPSCINHQKLRDGDVVKALICKDAGKSMIVRKVLNVERRWQELQRHGWCFVLEGSVETFSERVGGYGFLRPAEDSRELFESKGCAEGVFIYPAQIRRYRLRDGQRVLARIYPAEPPERSPKLVDILPDEQEDDVWQLLEKNEEDPASDDDADLPPQRIRKLLGIRMHGRISRVNLGRSGYYGFLKADHTDIPEEVFFRVERRNVEPREGEAVFFRLEIRRRGDGEWTPCAVNIHYHQQGMEIPEESAELLKPAEAPQSEAPKSPKSPKTSDPKESDEASKSPQKAGSAEALNEATTKSDDATKSDEVDEVKKSDESDEAMKQDESKESDAKAQPAEAAETAEAEGKQSNSERESLPPPEPAAPPRAQSVPEGKKWWEIDDPPQPQPVQPVQPSVAPRQSSEEPKARPRHWEPARKTYGKGDPDVVLSVEGNRFDRLKGKSKGDKGDKGGKGKAERKGDKGNKGNKGDKGDRDGKGSKGKSERGKGRDGRGKGPSKSEQGLQQNQQSQHQHPRPSGSRPIFGQPSGSGAGDWPERSKVHIHVHVNGQEMPRCPTPRGSIERMLPDPQAPPPPPHAPRVSIRPTVAPKKLNEKNEKKKKRKNRRNPNNFESTYPMDPMDPMDPMEMEMEEMEPEIDVRKSKLPGTSGPGSRDTLPPSRPKITPSQAPASAASASAASTSAPAKRKVTKVLQSRPKCMPRKPEDVPPDPAKSARFSAPELPPVKDEDDFIMVRVDQAAPSTSSPGQSDFVLVQVEMDEPKQLPRPKVEVKDEDWDDDW